MVTWGGTAFDVSNGVTRGRVAHGTGQVSADRAVIRSARGSVTLSGGKYIPGHPDAVADETAMRARSPIAVMQGPVVLWQGFIEGPRSVGPLQTSYRLTGGLTPFSSQRVEHAQDGAAFPGPEQWFGLLGQVPELAGLPHSGVQFAPFTFNGAVFRLLSDFGSVMGRLVGEDRQGRAVMPVYGRPVPEILFTDVNSNDLRIRAFPTSRSDTTGIRNRLVFDFEDTLESPRGRDIYRSYRPDTAQLPPDQYEIIIPTPVAPEGQVYSDFSVEVISAQGVFYSQWQSGLSFRLGRLDVLEHITVEGIEHQNVNSVITLNSALATARFEWSWLHTEIVPPRTAFQTFTRYNNLIFFAPTSPQTGTTSFGGFRYPWVGLELKVRLAWKTATSFSLRREFVNIPSQDDWGVRDVEFPPWVADADLAPSGDPNNPSNGDLIQADLDHLAQPREHHTVTLPLWQENAQQNALVGQLDFGDYVNLILGSPGPLPPEPPPPPGPPPRPANLRASVQATNVTLFWDLQLNTDSYVLRVGDGAEITIGGSAITHRFTGLEPHTNYRFFVAAQNAIGTSYFSQIDARTEEQDTFILDNQEIFETLFVGEQLGTNQGRWALQSSGTTAQTNTGPGTNNMLAYMHTNTPFDGMTNTSRDNNGALQFNTIPIGTGRRLRLRLCLQDVGSSQFHYRVQWRDTPTDNWSTTRQERLRSWGYSNSRNNGDTFNNWGGVSLACVADGGWVDWTVTIPDSSTQVRLIPQYGGINQDVALREVQWL